jgi:hypothetical protein
VIKLRLVDESGAVVQDVRSVEHRPVVGDLVRVGPVLYQVAELPVVHEYEPSLLHGEILVATLTVRKHEKTDASSGGKTKAERGVVKS